MLKKSIITTNSDLLLFAIDEFYGTCYRINWSLKELINESNTIAIFLFLLEKFIILFKGL